MILLSSSLTFGTTDNMCQSSVLVKRQEIFRGEGHVAGEGDQGPEDLVRIPDRLYHEQGHFFSEAKRTKTFLYTPLFRLITCHKILQFH